MILNIDALWEYFSQAGKVDACMIMRDAAGRSRCFAFLMFEEPASVNAVMVHEHFLDENRECFISPIRKTTLRLSSLHHLNSVEISLESLWRLKVQPQFPFKL